MKYSSWFINESFRINPVVAFSFPEILQEDTKFGNYTVPAGSEVVVDYFSINHNENVWENPTKCIPTRWENRKDINKYSFALSGMGSRRCPGITSIGMPMMKIVLYHLLSNYKVSSDTNDISYSPGKLNINNCQLVFNKL